jgi:hypothetical protein
MADVNIARDFIVPKSKVAVLVNGQYFSTEEPGNAGKIISAAAKQAGLMAFTVKLNGASFSSEREDEAISRGSTLELVTKDRCGMPTVLVTGPYRHFFYAGDDAEPPHVHVERDGKTAKFWLDPVRLQRTGRFNRRELQRIQKLVERDQVDLLKSWNEYFSH